MSMTWPEDHSEQTSEIPAASVRIVAATALPRPLASFDALCDTLRQEAEDRRAIMEELRSAVQEARQAAIAGWAEVKAILDQFAPRARATRARKPKHTPLADELL
jgi:hypothetical protein